MQKSIDERASRSLSNALCKVSGLFWTRYATHCSCIPIHIGEQQDGNIKFEALVLNWFPGACNNVGTVGSREGGLQKARSSKKY